MLKKGLFLHIILMLIFTFTSAFAIDAPAQVSVKAQDNGQAVISWSEVSGSIFYNVYYGNKPGKQSNYPQQTELTEQTNQMVDGLDRTKDYYFWVVSIDEDGNESIFSEEVLLKKELTGQNPFVLQQITSTWDTTLELQFSRGLEGGEDAQREFKIFEKSNKINTYEVLESQVQKDTTVLELTLDAPLVEKTNYELVVLELNDVDGNNIQSGIDSVEYFTYTPGVTPVVIEEETEVVDEEEIPLESAQEENNTNLAGTNVETKTVKNTAWDTKKLPKTGAESLLIVILALLLWGFILLYKKQKHI